MRFSWRDLFLLLPILLAIYYTASFSIPAPLTDEWFLTNNAMIVKQLGWSHPLDTLAALSWRTGDHPIALPNIVYILLAPRVNYDARVFMYITIACYAVVLWIFRMRIAKSAWTALPVAVVLFAPSHWMEFLWGFQFCSSLALVLPIIGMALMDETAETPTWKSFWCWLTLALLFVTAGGLSAGAGLFGFPALVLMLLARRLPWQKKLIAVALAVAAFLFLNAKARSGGSNFVVRDDSFSAAMTAIGGNITGISEGIFKFPFGLAPSIGLFFCLLTPLCVFIAWRKNALSALSLPIGLFVFGLLPAAAVAVTRPYVGNWHLEMALPAVVGAYGCVLILARSAPAVLSERLFVFTAGLLLMVIGAYADGWNYGRSYLAYTSKIDNYMRNYLAHPDAVRPYPQPSYLQFNADLARFLERRHFRRFPPPAQAPPASVP